MRRLRNAFVLGVMVGLVVALVRRMSAPPAPARPSPRPPRPTPSSNGAPSPSPVSAAANAEPSATKPEPEPEPPTTKPETKTGTEPEPQSAPSAEPAHGIDTTWAAPIDGDCPPGFPVKAKESSRIFHVPGGLSYDRTNPDRCYPTPEAAEADGFRAAKR